MRTRGLQSLDLPACTLADASGRTDLADMDLQRRPASVRAGCSLQGSAGGNEVIRLEGAQALSTPGIILADPEGWVDVAKKELRRRCAFNRQVAKVRPRYAGLENAYRKGKGRAPAIMVPQQYDISAECGDRAGRHPHDRSIAAALERLLSNRDLISHAVILAVIEMLDAKAVASPYHPDPALAEAMKYVGIALDIRAPFIRDREAHHDLVELGHASVDRPCHFRFSPDLAFLSLNRALVEVWGGRPDIVLLSAWSALQVGGHLLLYMAKGGPRHSLRLDAEKIGPALHRKGGTVLLLRKRSEATTS